MAPPGSPLTVRESTLLTLGIVAAGVAVDGLLMLLVGSGSFFPSTGTTAWVAPALTALGAAISSAAFLGLGRRARPVLEGTIPRLFPFAPLPVNAGIFVVLLVGAVSVFHGFFDVFTSAHNGGDVSTLSDQGDLSALLIGASVVVWILTIYAVLVMFRVFRLGRSIDAPVSGRDVYGRVIEETSGRDSWRPSRTPSPPVPGGARAVLFAVTLLLALVISAAIQILEVDVGPAPALAWLWAQPFTPLLSLPVAAGIGLVDRGLRDLEARYARRASTSPTPAEIRVASTDPRPAN
ncbi:MAG TPA: hypothetical protein VEY07_00285 [Thermoplasmata archaeon]|nr:hypothetical protein [Thermoplasmata archaeon]